MNNENLQGESSGKDLSLTSKKHFHKYIQDGNDSVCSICNKKKLFLNNSDKENLMTGTLKNGRNYSVRQDRKRYFFPDEWKMFISQFKNKKHRLFFLILIHTGARVMEAIHLKVKNFDLDRGTVNFEVVKRRTANRHATGTNRMFFVSEKLIKEVKNYVRNMNPEDYLFLDKKRLPVNYDSLNNSEKKKYYITTSVAFSSLLKRKMKTSGIKDYWNFSLHNVRKTYGN